jgi:hypothetical protein
VFLTQDLCRILGSAIFVDVLFFLHGFLTLNDPVSMRFSAAQYNALRMSTQESRNDKKLCPHQAKNG